MAAFLVRNDIDDRGDLGIPVGNRETYQLTSELLKDGLVKRVGIIDQPPSTLEVLGMTPLHVEIMKSEWHRLGVSDAQQFQLFISDKDRYFKQLGILITNGHVDSIVIACHAYESRLIRWRIERESSAVANRFRLAVVYPRFSSWNWWLYEDGRREIGTMYSRLLAFLLTPKEPQVWRIRTQSEFRKAAIGD